MVLRLASLTYNLTVLFQRHLGWRQQVMRRNLQLWLCVTAGVAEPSRRQEPPKLAVPKRERAWWRR